MTYKEIDRQGEIKFNCAIDRASDEIREAYLRGWLDAEQLSGHKANPKKFKTLICECDHRKDLHVPNKVRQDAGYAVCIISGCNCNRKY